MRIGPGPHLKGLQLMGGILPGEEVGTVVFSRSTLGDLPVGSVRLFPRNDYMLGGTSHDAAW